MVLLESETKACETKSYSPSLDGEQPLIECADDLDELDILGLKVAVEALGELGVGRSFS